MCLIKAVFDLGTIWRCVVSFTLQPLYPQGKILIVLDKFP
jgi:hypothetical protein